MTITRHTPLADLPEFLTVEELQIWLGIGRGLAYAQVRAGEIPSVRIGRLVRIPRAALVEMVAAKAVAS
jgi:excisionase family DNA binding protein